MAQKYELSQTAAQFAETNEKNAVGTEIQLKRQLNQAKDEVEAQRVKMKEDETQAANKIVQMKSTHDIRIQELLREVEVGRLAIRVEEQKSHEVI